MSQTDVRTFKAATMQEALEIVRRELGPNAVILNSRELPLPRFFKWRKSKDRVEITAGTGVNVRPPKAVSTFGSRKPESVPLGAAARPSATQRADDELAPPPPLLPAQGVQSVLPPTSVQPVNRVPSDNNGIGQQSAISRQLNSIEQMVSKLTLGSLHQQADIPPELFQLYTELIDCEVEENLARELIHRLKPQAGNEQPAEAGDTKSRLRSMVESDLRCAAPIMATPGQRKVVALVGPTGVGKTTTIAKLAANFRLRDGIRMGLVTVDTYRIAAVEQLRTYAEIIDLPMKVVTTPREMRRALDELAGLDLVLIDTAGRSPRDELKIQELKSLLAEAPVDEVHLVLSLAASPKSLQATAEKFAPAGTTSMILTKLDEAIGMGSLLSVSRRIPLPISYLTTGQDVPDDIEHAAARRMARLILGEETLHGRRAVGSR
jgi:flagellar biosynthesis protein FlhF